MPEEGDASPCISLQLGEHQRYEEGQVPSCMKIRAFLRLKSIGVCVWGGGHVLARGRVPSSIVSKLFLETESLPGQQDPGVLLSLFGQS